MPPRRYVAAAILLSVLISIYLVHTTGVGDKILGRPASHQPKLSLPTCLPSEEPGGSAGPDWEFKVERDGDNYGLTDEQCQAAFPKLFVEIERSVEARKGNPISFKEYDSRKLENGMVRAIIFEGELHIVDFEDMSNTFSRAKATLNSIHRALTASPNRHTLPNIEFLFTTEDYAIGSEPVWTYSKQDGDDWAWLMPDFAYWSWPEVGVGSYQAVRRRIAHVDDGAIVHGKVVPGLNFQDKHKRLLWRGNVDTAPELRGQLIKATTGKSWASVYPLHWADKSSLKKNLIPMEDHCEYMFLAHTEGRSFSGRGKYLLNCRSVVVSHKLRWREAHHGALISSGPDTNFIEVERDFSGLESKINYLLDHPDVAEQIAENSIKTFRDRYLTPAAEACYWRRLIRAYASVCDFEPTFYTDSQGTKSRGVPYETFLLTGAVKGDD